MVPDILMTETTQDVTKKQRYGRTLRLYDGEYIFLCRYLSVTVADASDANLFIKI